MNRPVDRRILKTQAALREAFIRLLTHQTYESITVEQILVEANVGRSTFYAHCSGKDDLLRLCFRMLQAELTDACPSSGPPFPLAFALPVLRHLADHRGLYAAFSGERAGALLLDELYKLVSELARRDLARLPQADAVAREIRQQFVVGAFTGLLAWWLKAKARLEPEAMDAMFQQLVADGIAPAHTSPTGRA